MRLSQIDLNLFLVFDAVYQQRNLTRAAEVLCITQPAVSNALARLRSTLDDPLFVRTSQGMMPTPLAENIVGRVQEALQLLTTSVTEGEVFDPTHTEKVFRLSMNDMMESILLPKLLSRLQSEAPQLGLECYHVKRDDIERELAAGTLDFALDIPVVASPQVCAEPMASNQRYACVVRKDHPFIGDTLTLDDYLSLDHLQVSSRRKGGSYEDVALNRLGRQRHIRMRVQHYRVAPLLVAVSDMALTIPMDLALTLDLKVLELPFSTAPLGTNLYWHKSADHDKANQWMRELIREIY